MEEGLSEVAKLFVELAAIPSPSGHERAVADSVVDYLRGLALAVDEDDAGARIDATMGNLLCRVEPTADGTPLFREFIGAAAERSRARTGVEQAGVPA